MSPIQVATGFKHDCKTDGHIPALRARWELDSVEVTPFCEICHAIGLPSASMTETKPFFTKWLMKVVEDFRFAPDAPPEAYEGMFRDDAD